MNHFYARLATSLAGFTLWLSCGSARAASPDIPLAQVRVASVEFSSIGPDGLEATIHISARANSAAVIRQLVFDGVTINGVRLHVPTVSGPIHLRAGEAVEDLPKITASLTYQELESLEPVRRALREGHAELRGHVHAQVELSLFQKIVLLTSNAWATLPIDQEITVDPPGGVLGRAAAFATLLAAEPVWIVGQAAREWRQNQTAVAVRVRSEMYQRVVAFETRYDVKAKNGERLTLRNLSLGMLTEGGRVLATAEVLEPWVFDDAQAQALQRGEGQVDNASVNVTATLLSSSGDQTTFSLERNELRVVKELGGGATGISTDRKQRYRVRFRDNNTNAVLFDIPALRDSATALQPDENADAGSWQPAAVVRLERAGSKLAPAVWLTEARYEEGRYHIKDVVDSAAIGSPLWVEGGIVGLLQDEGSAAEVRGLLKKMR